MTIPSIQSSFAAGEVSPSLFGRVDLVKYHQGLSTLRNFFVNYRGGASSRAGYAYIGMCKQGAPNIGASGTMANPPRDIPFQFNINQGYVLEFGSQYMRIKSDGAYVLENNVTVSSVSVVGLFTTAAPHGYSIGDWVFDNGNTGFNGLAWIVKTVPTGSTFTVTDLFGNTISSATASGAGAIARVYTVVAPYAAIDLPFLKFTQSADTMSLCCVNQDTQTEYPTYELTRVGNTNWTFTLVSFASVIAPPSGISAVAQASTTLSTWYSYVVTAVDSATNQESIASTVVNVENNDISINAGSNTISWSPVAGAAYYNIYKATPSYSVQVPIGSLYGFMARAFGTQAVDTNVTADFTKTPPTHQDPFARSAITAVNITSAGSALSQATVGYTITTSTGTGFIGTPVISDSSLTNMIIQNGGSGYAPADTITFGTKASGTYTFTANPTATQTIILNGVTWTFVTGTPAAAQTQIRSTVAQTLTALVTDLTASANAGINVANYTLNGLVLSITYKVIGTGGNGYTLAAGTYGGSVSAATLTGGATGGATGTLTVGPSTGTYPATVAYYQQRRVYGYTLNNPDTYFFTRPGAFYNMDSSIPTIDSDAFTGTPWAQQVNGIQFMVPMTTGLVTLTGNGAWLVNGGSASAITPSNQTATAQAYNGSHFHIPPIIVNYDILYVQSKGSIVRDLAYNFYTNIFTGTDQTILSNHLFNFHQLQQWAYAEEPYKVIWCTRDDGVMLSFTFLKEQEIAGWARHDTNGFFVGVCSVTEPPVDAVYVITKRYITGRNVWVYYSERADNRNWLNVEDSFCVDAGLAYPMTYPNATLTPAAIEGTGNISSVLVIQGGSDYTAPIISANSPDGEGVGATFSVTLSGGAITAITPLTQGTGYIAGSTLTISDATGSGAIAQPVVTNNVTFTASASVFSSGNVDNVIRIGNSNAGTGDVTGVTANGGGKAIITAYTSGTQVTANIIEPITNIVPDNLNDMPAPIIANQWSLSVPTSTITGLNHLEGMTVAILGDGSVVPNQVVTNGSITLPSAASSIKIGLPYTCQLQSLYLDAQSEVTMQGKRKNIQAVTVRVDRSRGLALGTNQPDQSTQPNNATIPWTNMKEIKERNASIYAGSAIPLYVGDERILVPGEWSKRGQIAAQQIYPLPANILALVCEYTQGDTSA